ncbi:hypothetical protein A2U01_0086686, partial [Trifolium medium]|nr:hypothetical protein [Trifolium medium]
METSLHLFLQFSFASKIWNWLATLLQVNLNLTNHHE